MKRKTSNITQHKRKYPEGFNKGPMYEEILWSLALYSSETSSIKITYKQGMEASEM